MRSFLTRFASIVTGVLSGLDRLFFRGSLRGIAYPAGMQKYLWANHILLKDFAQHSLEVTAQLQEASLRQAKQLGREIRYINSSDVRKEDVAREIAERDRIREGLICVLRSVDPCMSVQISKNHQTKKLEIRYRRRKCLHLYHYQIHPVFGFMHARIQTWFPFSIYVCINGREWLARQMDQIRLRYQRRHNTFTWLEDLAQTQELFDQQLQANWPSLLGGLVETLNPIHADIFAKLPCKYYWSVADSEWASDVMFTSRPALQKIYPQLVRYAITTFDSVDVMRFLGKPIPVSGKLPFARRHEVISNVKERLEGCRVKHWLNQNSIKIYDKISNLRVECTLRQPRDFKVYRPKEGDPEGPKEWRMMRSGIADLHRRAEVSQAANERYLEALAAVHDTTPLRQLADVLCGPAVEPARCPSSTRAAAVEPTAGAMPQRQERATPANVATASEEPAAMQENAAAKLEGQSPCATAASATAQENGTAENAVGGPQMSAGVVLMADNPGPPPAAAGAETTRTSPGAPSVVAEERVTPPGETSTMEIPTEETATSPPETQPTMTSLTNPVIGKSRARRVRALNPLGATDAALLQAVSRHEFMINGLRNRDLRRLLYGDEASKPEQRRRSAAVTRQLRLLRAHGLIRKVPRTHRYMVSEAGRRTITAVLAARNASADRLIKCSA